MGCRFHIGTRKGLFEVEQKGAGKWVISKPVFLGDPVTMVLSNPYTGDRFAALNLGHFGIKLFRAEGKGNWQEISAPKFPLAEGDDGPSVELIWELVPGGADKPETLWLGTIPGGLFVSGDRGDSWALVENLWQKPEREFWFGGGFDKPGIHSICVHPENPQRISLAISCGGVWESMDGGNSWLQEAKGIRAEYLPPDKAYEPTSQDAHRMVRCHASPQSLWIQHHNGIFRSVDGGKNWSEIEQAGPSIFGFAVAVHPHEPDTAWFVPAIKDERRVPVDAKLVVTRTRDGGASFDVLSKGLPQGPAYDLVYRHALDIDDSGDVLAFGSTTGGLWVSEDQGDSWQCLSAHLPPVNVVSFEKAGN